MAATDLYKLCREYLDVCAEALEESPGGPIDRQYVAPGPPAWDCIQLTVHAGGPRIGDTAPLQPSLQAGHRLTTTGHVNLVTMTATVLRCVPVLQEQGQTLLFPDPDSIEAASQVTLGDLWAIWNHIASRKRAGTLWAPREREVVFDPAIALLTQGGLAGWEIQTSVQLGGYKT